MPATRAGEQVRLDTFPVGKLKGVGAIWAFTAVDVATRWTVARLITGENTDEAAAGFLRQLAHALGAVRVELTGIRTDRGPEFTGRAFRTAAAELGLRHHLCPPNHHAVVERFQGTVSHEFSRPFFHRGYVDDLAILDAAFQRWIGHCNRDRANHGAAQSPNCAPCVTAHLNPRPKAMGL
ncbi:integrase catalytic domain-containing protein [Carbonactinospora thermoautotrophica]|uniref:integrase catalytic domain-containing protein n=1 Tax=Carbonactinospora thermoautotrophica TaxID=1469144 RepID=UPI002271C89F|nr:transposase family protein [Carbonactinospora thermoautotrophica]